VGITHSIAKNGIKNAPSFGLQCNASEKTGCPLLYEPTLVPPARRALPEGQVAGAHGSGYPAPTAVKFAHVCSTGELRRGRGCESREGDSREDGPASSGNTASRRLCPRNHLRSRGCSACSSGAPMRRGDTLSCCRNSARPSCKAPMALPALPRQTGRLFQCHDVVTTRLRFIVSLSPTLPPRNRGCGIFHC